MAAARIAFRYIWPADPLRASLFCYWETKVQPGEPVADLNLPAWATIRLVGDGDWFFGNERETMTPVPSRAILQGLTRKAGWFGCRGEGRAFTIHLYPRGWHDLMQRAGDDFVDKMVPLTDVMGEAADQLLSLVQDLPDFDSRAAAIDDFFLQRMHVAQPDLAFRLSAIALAIADTSCNTVEILSERVGMSEPALYRLTRRYFGLSPKAMLRRHRFLRMVHTMEARPYKEWADFIDPQYVDQSHMIRDFQHFVGMSPGQYFTRDRPFMDRAAEAIKDYLAQEAGHCRRWRANIMVTDAKPGGCGANRTLFRRLNRFGSQSSCNKVSRHARNMLDILRL